MTRGAFQEKFSPATCTDLNLRCSRGFVAKINPEGTALVYSTLLGGSGYDFAYGIGVDSSGRAFIVGDTTSVDFPTTPDARNHDFPRQSSAVFLSELDSSGSQLLYSTFLRGEQGRYVAISGDVVYVAGNVINLGLPNLGLPQVNAIQAGLGGVDEGNQVARCPDLTTIRYCWDTFLAAFRAPGMEMIFSTYLGGSTDDGVRGLAVDGAGNAVIAGQSYAVGTVGISYQIGYSPAWPLPGSKSQHKFITRITTEGTGPVIPLRGLRNAADSSFLNRIVPGLIQTIYGRNITAREIEATVPTPPDAPWVHLAVVNNGRKSLPVLTATNFEFLMAPAFFLQGDGLIWAVHDNGDRGQSRTA